MESTDTINIENHRTRERIKLLGEVFTPDLYVNKMLDLLDVRVWSDENVVLFEPTCGHGNFLVAIAQRRLIALEKKYRRNQMQEPYLYAIANTLNTIWGIDIDHQNVCLTRKRLFTEITNNLILNKFNLNRKNKIFLAHVLAAIIWQISVNEALSALAKSGQEEKEGSKTNLGKIWLRNHDPKPINFANSWVKHFSDTLTFGAEPILLKKALDAIEKVISGKGVRDDEFSFATDHIQKLVANSKASRKQVA